MVVEVHSSTTAPPRPRVRSIFLGVSWSPFLPVGQPVSSIGSAGERVDDDATHVTFLVLFPAWVLVPQVVVPTVLVLAHRGVVLDVLGHSIGTTMLRSASVSLDQDLSSEPHQIKAS